jgi:hypothetical protein
MFLFPHEFFDEKDRGIIRCIMGAMKASDWVDDDGRFDQDEALCDSTGVWIELPGPPEWWPDADASQKAENYFARFGFAPREDLGDGYRKALWALSQDEPPLGWAENMLHEAAPHDWVWNMWFGRTYM